MKIYPFLCRNASYCFMFCADRTDRQSTRKRSKKSFPHSLSIFTIRCHTSMPKNGHGSDDPCAERTELGRNRQHPRRWPLPYCCCMVPSRQKTLSIPAPYRCHIRPMPDHSNCDLDTTQKKTAPSSDGAVSHTSYSRSAMIDPAACTTHEAAPQNRSAHLSVRHHTPGRSFPSRPQRSSIPAKDALHPRSLSLAIPSPCSCTPGSEGRPLSERTTRPRRNERPSAHRAEGLFGVGIYLLSRAASSQVSSTRVSLTAVFGMGTGVPSPSSTPTICGYPPPISASLFAR